MDDDPVVELVARRPSAGDDDPERLRTLLELLDRPDQVSTTIWVEGPYGGGSTVAMVAALLTALNITTGTVTTSHLQDLRERIRIAGSAIGSHALREQLAYLDPFLREVDTRFAEPLAFDEVLFALAMTWFADAPVDVVVAQGAPPPTARCDIHARLGEGHGRPSLLVGNDTVGSDTGVSERELAVGGQQVSLVGITTRTSDVYLPLHGAHQAENAAVALSTVDLLTGDRLPHGLDADLVRDAFARVRLPGRLEVVRRTDGASVVLDAAHDAATASALCFALSQEFAVRHRIGVVGVGRSDPVLFLEALAPALDHVVVTASPEANAAPPAAVLAAARELGLPAESADTVDAAIDSATGVATAEDLVVVAGGAQTVGAARRALRLDPLEELLAAPDS
ncbi:MAG TPA: cyanophycin synthetase [Euzebyales bacterium]